MFMAKVGSIILINQLSLEQRCPILLFHDMDGWIIVTIQNVNDLYILTIFDVNRYINILIDILIDI